MDDARNLEDGLAAILQNLRTQWLQTILDGSWENPDRTITFSGKTIDLIQTEMMLAYEELTPGQKHQLILWARDIIRYIIGL